MTHLRINDFTNAEISAMQAEFVKRTKKREAACMWCGTVKEMRPDQHYCKPQCRAAASREMARVAYEKLQMDNAAWVTERSELVHEISELRKQLLALGIEPYSTDTSQIP